MGIHLNLGPARRAGFHVLDSILGGRIGQHPTVHPEDDERNEHHDNGGHECVLESPAKDIEVVGGKTAQLASRCAADNGCIGRLLQVGQTLWQHPGSLLQVLMAQLWERGIVAEPIVLQPPVTHPYGYEWGKKSPNIDEHVEDLES